MQLIGAVIAMQAAQHDKRYASSSIGPTLAKSARMGHPRSVMRKEERQRDEGRATRPVCEEKEVTHYEPELMGQLRKFAGEEETDLLPAFRTSPSVISDEGKGKEYVEEQAHGSGDDRSAEGGWPTQRGFRCVGKPTRHSSHRLQQLNSAPSASRR